MRGVATVLFSVLCLIMGMDVNDVFCQEPQTGSETAPAAGAFNPYSGHELPNLRTPDAQGREMLAALGAKPQTIVGETRHRPNWREELYPVLFGERLAPHEILVILDFSRPESEEVWSEIVRASQSLDPQKANIVLYGLNGEHYGTDLTGFAIWLARERPENAMPWLTYALSQWNTIKAAQKRKGSVKVFSSEYDAVADNTSKPIIYTYMPYINPPVPSEQEMKIAGESYNAGNVNMYQASQVRQYYGAKKLPAVIVDGVVIPNATAGAIIGKIGG